MRMARLLSLVVVTVLLLASGPVGAQQPVAPPPPQIPYGAPISLEQAKKVLAEERLEIHAGSGREDAGGAQALVGGLYRKAGSTLRRRYPPGALVTPERTSRPGDERVDHSAGVTSPLA